MTHRNMQQMEKRAQGYTFTRHTCTKLCTVQIMAVPKQVNPCTWCCLHPPTPHLLPTQTHTHQLSRQQDCPKHVTWLSSPLHCFLYEWMETPLNRICHVAEKSTTWIRTATTITKAAVQFCLCHKLWVIISCLWFCVVRVWDNSTQDVEGFMMWSPSWGYLLSLNHKTTYLPSLTLFLLMFYTIYDGSGFVSRHLIMNTLTYKDDYYQLKSK